MGTFNFLRPRRYKLTEGDDKIMHLPRRTRTQLSSAEDRQKLTNARYITLSLSIVAVNKDGAFYYPRFGRRRSQRKKMENNAKDIDKTLFGTYFL